MNTDKWQDIKECPLPKPSLRDFCITKDQYEDMDILVYGHNRHNFYQEYRILSYTGKGPEHINIIFDEDFVITHWKLIVNPHYELVDDYISNLQKTVKTIPYNDGQSGDYNVKFSKRNID